MNNETPVVGGEHCSGAGARGAQRVKLESALFGRQWQKTPAGKRVRQEVTESRAVGLVKATTAQGPVEGVLVRHAREKTYRLVGVDFSLPLDTGATEAFLTKLRRGHQGGSGRTQGPLAADGQFYTIRKTITLPMSVIEDVSKRGNGTMSVGMRKLGTLVRRRLVDRDGEVRDLRSLTDRVNNTTGLDGAATMVRAYLDAQSIETFTALGGGSLSRGVRFAVWMADKRLK